MIAKHIFSEHVVLNTSLFVSTHEHIVCTFVYWIHHYDGANALACVVNTME